jgi:raffinose/stachyose/melibiose transport system substrate-binding protein
MRTRTVLRMGARTVMLIVVALALSLPLFANGSKEGGSSVPTVRFAHLWPGSDGFGGNFNPGLQKFVQDNKSVANYSVEVAQGDDLRNKIKIDLAANNLPDVFFYWALSSLKPMVDQGLILDEKEYVAKSTALKWSDISQSAWDEYTTDGQHYWAIPATGFKDFTLVNKTIFQKYNLPYPKTYDDLLADAKVFSANGIVPLAVGSKGGNPAHFLFAEMYYQYGTLDYMKKVGTGETKFNDPLNTKVANIVLDMAKGGVFPKDTIGNGDFAPAVALYNDGKAAMILGQTWSIPNFKPDVVANSELIYYPKFKDAVHDPSTFTVGGVNNGWVINKKAFDDPKKQAAIVKLMDWLNSDQVVGWFAQSGQYVYKNIDMSKVQVPVLYSEVLQFTKNQAGLTNFWILMPDPVSQEVLSTTLDDLWAQNISAKGFVDKVQASVDKALGK